MKEEVERHAERSLGGAEPPLGDEGATTSAVLASLTGFGPLQRLLDAESVEEIWINSPTWVFAACCGGPELTSVVLGNGGDLVERMLQHSGRRLDLSNPFIQPAGPPIDTSTIALSRRTVCSAWVVGVALVTHPAAIHMDVTSPQHRRSRKPP